MKVLRAIFYLFLAANLVLAVANLGGFSRAPGGEPERLSSQLHPEKIRIIPEAQTAAESAKKSKEAPVEKASEPEAPPVSEAPAPQPAASSPTLSLACVSWSGLTRAQADEVASRAGRAGFKLREHAQTTPGSWWVNIPPLADRAAAERKASELRNLGVTEFFIINDAGPTQNAISLGLYKNEESAKRMLDKLRTSGVQSARISVREMSSFKLEVTGTADPLAGFSSDVSARVPAAPRANCAPQR